MSNRIGIGIDVFGGLGKIAKLIIAYFARVTAGGGVVEGEACLGTKLTNLDTIELLDNASLITIPSGYKSGVVYSQVPTSGAGDLDFTRASTATRINSSSLIESVASGVPRLTYPIGDGCPSLLLEPQRTNLVTYSNDFSNAAWTKSGTIVTPNYAISPDGTQNASRLQLPFPNTQLFQAVGVQDSSTSSIYIKGTAGQTIGLYNSFLGAGTYELKTLNGEWQRITVSSVGTIMSYFAISNFLSATANDVLIYGSQLELGSYPTSYIPTTTATVTRLADTASKTGISSLIGQSEGTLFIDTIVGNATSGGTNFLNTNRSANTISSFSLLRITANNTIRFQQYFGNGTFDSFTLNSTNSFVSGQRIKIAVRYKSGDYAMYINGVLESTNTTTITMIGSKNELYLNDSAGYYADQENMIFNQVAIYKTGLSNSQLASLTTI